MKSNLSAVIAENYLIKELCTDVCVIKHLLLIYLLILVWTERDWLIKKHQGSACTPAFCFSFFTSHFRRPKKNWKRDSWGNKLWWTPPPSEIKWPLLPLTRYSLRLSYMLLDWAQILKGSGFFWRVPLVGGSNGGRLGRGWVGGGGTGGGAASVSAGTGGTAGTARAGESVWVLRWLHTLCWELPWLSFLSNC